MEGHLFAFGISLLGLLLVGINAILYLSKVKKIRSTPYRMLAVYLVSIFLIEIICHYVGAKYPGKNLYLSHFLFNVSFLVLSFFFYTLFEYKTLKKIVVAITFFFYILLSIQYYIMPELFWRFSLFEISFISLTLIIYVLTHFYTHLGKRIPYPYFCLGLLIYLMCTTIIFLSGNIDVVIFRKPFIDIWVIDDLLFITFQLFIYMQWRLSNKKI